MRGKFESRNPKQIQNDERKTASNIPNRRNQIRRFGFSEFEFISQRFVSNFDIRIWLF